MLTKSKRRAQRRKRNQIARQLHEGRTGPYKLQVQQDKRLKHKLKQIKLEELEGEYERQVSEALQQRTKLDDIQE